MKIFPIALLGSVLSMSAWAEPFTVETIEQPGIHWRFHRIHVSPQADTTVVSGRLNAASRFGLERGHVDVAAFAPSGKLLAETTTLHTSGFLSPKIHRRGGKRFEATLSKKLPAGSVVKLAFHREPFVPPAPPSHQANIAR
jgi:hypothetical protein